MREKRLDLYIVRIIACFMVILTHISADPMVAEVPPHTFYKLVNASSKFCVPLFVFLSGFLLEYNYKKGGKYYSKIWKRLVLPYLFWLSAYYTYFIFEGVYIFDFGQWAFGAITGGIVFHLYYMLISIQLYLLYPLIRKIVDLTGFLPMVLISFITARYSGRIPYFQIMLSTYLLYAIIGIWFVRWESKWKARSGTRSGMYLFWMGLLLYLGTVVLFYYSYSSRYIIFHKIYILGSCTGIIGVYFITHALNPLQKYLHKTIFSLIQSVSNSTLAIYYIHVFIMYFMVKIAPPNRLLYLFFAQLSGIMFVWMLISMFGIRIYRKF